MRRVTRPAISPVQVLRRVPRMAFRLRVPMLAALAALLALPAFAQPAHAAGSGLTVHATDFSFQTNVATVTPGPVHIAFFNDSKDYEHEVFVFPADQPKLDAFLAAKRAGQEVAESDFLTGIVGSVEDVPAGQSIAFDATFPAGNYVLACFVSSPIAGQDTIHYDLGMHSGLVAGAEVAPAPTAAPAQPSVPSAAPAAVNVQAPNAGTGPGDGGFGVMWIASLVAIGALAMAGGGVMRRASRRR